MTCRIDPHWSLHGLRCIRMQNRELALDVLPERGGNIFRLLDKRRDADVLWKNPRVRPHIAPLHGNFDDHWAGGWDEAFPGGAVSQNRYGETLPYMGEIWSQPCDWRVLEAASDRAVLELDITTPITPARFTRRLILDGDSPVLRIEYRIENVGTQAFDFNWGTHPCQALGESWRFDVPATEGEVDECAGDLLGRPAERYTWPILRGRDVRRALPANANVFGMHYLTGLRDGWVAATDTAARRGFGLCFDRELFPCVWLVLVFGGFRSFHQALMEPWTGYPSRLADAVAVQRARVLEPGAVLETAVTAVLYGGVASVGSLAEDGSVTSEESSNDGESR
jgi:galactose mutarotase-like enzyme